MTVRIRGLDAKGTKVGTLVDALAQVNGINIDSVSFDIFDKTALQTQARTAAFNDAKSKASDYASFAGLSLGRVIFIDDNYYVSSPPIITGKVAFASAARLDSSTSVPVGEQDVSYSVVVTFQLAA